MRLTSTFILAAVCLSVAAQNDFNSQDCCTSIMVGRKATTDGSVITSHTCDGGYRSSAYIRPACDYPRDTVMNVYQGTMHTDYATDRSPLKVRGQIPQVRHTFRYLDTAYPCMNEHQVAMGETTFGGKDILRDPEGMFLIEELQRVALERCTTARDAVRLMGELAEKYGYGDGGECLTVADPREVWHFEIMGAGKGKKSAVWAAVRIPDDEIGVSANICRLGRLDQYDKNDVMASKNLEKVAKELELWDGKEPFSFYKAFGTNYAHPNEKKNFDIREYFIFNALAPSKHFDYNAPELPISVKPDSLVSVEDVLALFRQTYEGTEYGQTNGLCIPVTKDGKTDTIISPRANPWMTGDDKKLLGALCGRKIAPYRGVAVNFCSYGTVIQCRDGKPDDIGGVVWMSYDNPGQSPRIPIYCGTTALPEAMTTNGNNRYNPQAAIWHFRTPNKLAALNWGKKKKAHEGAIQHFQDKGLNEMAYVEARYNEIAAKEGREAAQQFLNDYTADFLGAAMMRWDDMGRNLQFSGKYGL